MHTHSKIALEYRSKADLIKTSDRPPRRSLSTTSTLNTMHPPIMPSTRLVRSGFALLAATALASFPISVHAAAYFWDDASGIDSNFNTAGNWDPDDVPSIADLAVVNNGALSAVQITSEVTVDSLRISNGGSVMHTAGVLNIFNGIGGDNGLWVGEFGPAQSTYTLNGGTILIDDPADGFQIARGNSNSAVFNLLSGTVTNAVGDTVIGLDGTATWNQTGGVFTAAGVQIGWFQSPTATVNLSGNAVWNATGLTLLSDGAASFEAAIRSDLNIAGPNVVFSSGGLVIRSKGNLNFDGTAGGFSTINLNNGQLLLDNATLNLTGLPEPGAPGTEIVLIDNIGSYTGNAAFANAPDGAIIGGYELDYRGNQLVLVAVPEPGVIVLLAAGLGATLLLRRRSRA